MMEMKGYRKGLVRVLAYPWLTTKATTGAEARVDPVALRGAEAPLFHGCTQAGLRASTVVRIDGCTHAGLYACTVTRLRLFRDPHTFSKFSGAS